MAQGPAGVTIHDNAGVHQNENGGVYQNPNTHSPQNDYNNPRNGPTIKTENTIDVTWNENEAEYEDENEHEDLEKAPTKNNSEDAECNNATEPNTVSNTMDKQYSTQTRTNMRARKRKSDLPLKLPIHHKTSSKLSNILNDNTMVKTMGNTHLDLRDYARLHVIIHCGTNQHDNVMRNSLITTILTQYHVSKGLKVFGKPGVAADLKELKQLNDIMVRDPKTLTK